MPTAPVTTYSNNVVQPYMDPEDMLETPVTLVAGTYPAGTVVGQVTGGNFKAYASASADGSQVPKGIIRFATTVDGSGNHNWGGDLGAVTPSVPMAFAGTFIGSDLPNIDATALTNAPSWRLLWGTATTGAIRLG